MSRKAKSIKQVAEPDCIITVEALQCRAGLCMETVNEYAEAYRANVKMPPILCYRIDDILYVVDGFHRLEAAKLAGVDEIEVDVEEGTMEDAQWASFSVNHTHGQRRTNDDKRRTVQMALAHPKSKLLSTRKLAEHCGVSNWMISQYQRGGNCESLTPAPPEEGESEEWDVLDVEDVGCENEEDNDEDGEGEGQPPKPKRRPLKVDFGDWDPDKAGLEAIKAIRNVFRSWPPSASHLVRGLLKKLVSQDHSSWTKK